MVHVGISSDRYHAPSLGVEDSLGARPPAHAVRPALKKIKNRLMFCDLRGGRDPLSLARLQP